jgi:thiol-disulfide isomerase/thioredoxin
MSRKRDRERQEQSRTRRRRTVIVAVASVVGVLGILGLMTVVGSASQSSATGGGSGGDPKLVAAANLRPCPNSSGNVTAVVDGLPADALPCLGEGPDFSLASLTGKPAIVNVWGSWCPPCREELPWFATLDEAAAGQLQIVGVDVSDTADSALTTLADIGVHYPSVFDPQGKTRVSLQWAGGTPVTLLVRADGSIAHRIEGRLPDEATLRALVAEHLGVTFGPS